MINNIKITTKYRCRLKKVKETCIRISSCPLYFVGLYLCNNGIIELDWIQIITLSRLTNEYFTII